jgi:hypothetical protein
MFMYGLYNSASVMVIENSAGGVLQNFLSLSPSSLFFMLKQSDENHLLHFSNGATLDHYVIV